MKVCAYSQGFYLFIFNGKQQRDPIFRLGPYFTGTKGMFLSHWDLVFDPELEIMVDPMGVRFPNLPIILWYESNFKEIENKLGKYIDKTEPKEGFISCCRIYVDIDLEKGFPEDIQLNVARWNTGGVILKP